MWEFTRDKISGEGEGAMTKPSIGFEHGVPEGQKTRWEVKRGEGYVVYTKTRSRDNWFLYNCEWHRGSQVTATSCSGPNDLSQDEVEKLQRFLDMFDGKF
jgi:hypothetical protein